MPDDATSSFAAAIHDHLELRRRNAALEPEMPLASYLPPPASQEAGRVGRRAKLDEDEDTLANAVWPTQPGA
jgi:hypothetical protein